MSDKPPHVLEPQDQSQGRPATFIFLHGYGDDGEGLPQGLAQQFQWYNKLPYLRWVLPNAPIHPEAGVRAWYTPRALPNALKPRVPGHPDEAEEEAASTADDEAGILRSCDTVDQLVAREIERGVDPARIVVGGFSQGCAVSLVWGLVGRRRHDVAGVYPASGYFPLVDRVAEIRRERGIEPVDGHEEAEVKKWLYVHGSKDILVPGRFFEQGKTDLKRWVEGKNLIDRMYEGMGHSTCNKQLRDMLMWLSDIAPP